MDTSIFGRSNNGNTAPSIEDRYDTTLKLMSTSRRAHMEDQRTNQPPDSVDSSLSSFKFFKRFDKTNASSNPSDGVPSPSLLLQPQRRLLSHIPPRISASSFSNPVNRRSPLPAESPTASMNLRNANENASNRASSPFAISQESDCRAYTHSKHQRSFSPSPQASFRLSSLGRADTQRLSTTAMQVIPQDSAQKRPSYTALLFDQVETNRNQLKIEIDKLETLQSQELDQYESRLASTTSQLESANAELAKTRASFASSKEKILILENQHVSLTASLSEAKSELSIISGDRERLREVHAQDRADNDQLRKRVEASKKIIAVLKEKSDSREVDFTYLTKAHDRLCAVVDALKKEAEETKILANDALLGVEPLIDSDATLRRAANTKAVLKELQDDLAASQRVTDLLRDKLYNQSSLLVDARDRVRDLEEEKRTSLEELIQGRKEVTERFAEVEIKVGELVKKLASREMETIDVLASSAALATELEVLKKASEANNVELAALRVIKEESISKLLASQSVINAREKEIVSLKGEVKTLGELRAESRVLLLEAKKLLGEKEVEIRAKDPNWDLEFNIKELNTQVVSLKEDLHTCQEALHNREIEIKRDAERLNAELAMSQTTTANLRDVLECSRSKEASTTCKYEVLLAELEHVRKVFQGQEHVLLESNIELKERLEVQSVSLFQAKEESSKLKIALAISQEQKASVDTFVNLHSQRASSAERTASVIETQLKEAQAMVADLQSHLRRAETELKLARESLVLSDQMITSALSERTNKLEKLVKDLEQQNKELSRRSTDILLRYQQGNVTDIENSFVAYIMKQTQDIHEQSVVTKNNELQRRETMIQFLQAKIIDMEVSIARMIKEKENLQQVKPLVVKSVVSLNRWLSDGPVDVEAANHSPESGIVGQNPTPPTATGILSTETNSSMPVKPSDPKFSRFENSNDDDSEDDIPLSDLSRLASDGQQHAGSKRPRPPSPVVPDEEPNRSRRRTRESVAQKFVLPQVPEASSIPAPVVATVAITAKNRQKKRR